MESKQQEQTIQRLPKHLKKFVVQQNYDEYTARDHTVWRFIMRNSRNHLKKHAHPIYLKGLDKAGIPTDRIPNIVEMDRVLVDFEWGAICVCGFIPPLVFLDFLSQRVLPIAADMRSYDHIGYTPAPDIVHEAAGHAPIIADPEYRKYLASYAHIARKAIFSLEDIKLYEAIRLLSDLKENPEATQSSIDEANANFAEASAKCTWVSEASWISRLFWWTAEYGLVGEIEKPYLYGAGLLSSLGESRSCLNPKVKKHPLNKQCMNQSYDITEPQPQLFVAKSFQELTKILHELEKDLSFRKGGRESLEKALKSQATTTTVLDSGLEITGILVQIEGLGENFHYLRWEGPVQLAYQGKELVGHSVKRHQEGFSLPLGDFTSGKNNSNLYTLSLDDLEKFNISINQYSNINFPSGIKLKGKLISQLEKDNKLLLLTFADCTITYEDKIIFDPSWGEYDLAIGCAVPSVYGGPADWESYGNYNFGKASTQPNNRKKAATIEEKNLISIYEQLIKMRECKEPEIESYLSLCQKILDLNKPEWLMGLEAIELANKKYPSDDRAQNCVEKIKMSILSPEKHDKETQSYISLGLEL